MSGVENSHQRQPSSILPARANRMGHRVHASHIQVFASRGCGKFFKTPNCSQTCVVHGFWVPSPKGLTRTDAGHVLEAFRPKPLLSAFALQLSGGRGTLLPRCVFCLGILIYSPAMPILSS